MKLTMVPAGVFLTLLTLLTINTAAAGINTAVEACIKKNAPESTVIQNIQLKSEGPMFEEDILYATVYWKQLSDGNSNLLAVFDEPEDISGSKLLFLEKKPKKEIYLSMPGFKVRRIKSSRISSSMYGMDFSYEDFQWLYNMLETVNHEQRSEVTLNGELMYVLAAVPVDAASSKYEEVVSYFEQKTCVIRKVEFYEKGQSLRKIMSADPEAVRKINGILVPHVFLMRDLKKDSETELTVTEVQVDPSIPNSVFDPMQLKEFSGIE